MFGTTTHPIEAGLPLTDDSLFEISTDVIETELITLETEISIRRALQLQLLAELDHRQTAQADGCRTLTEWVTARLDIDSSIAAQMVECALTITPGSTISESLREGLITLDRAHAVARLEATGVDGALDTAWNYDLAGVRRLAATRTRMSPTDEQEQFEDRYYAAQPNLDNTGGRFWGQLAGLAWTTLDVAVRLRADELPTLPDGTRDTLRHRMADALTSTAEDSLGSTTTTGTVHTIPTFVDAADALSGDGGIGVYSQDGLTLGPNTLSELLCLAPIETILTGLGDGVPQKAARAQRRIPTATRKYVLARDQVCTADGCSSRHRTEPHHIIERQHGGSDHPDNLASLVLVSPPRGHPSTAFHP